MSAKEPDLKRGTRVKVTFTGTMVARPLTFHTEGMVAPARVKVDGLPGWWAVVPESIVEILEE